MMMLKLNLQSSATQTEIGDKEPMIVMLGDIKRAIQSEHEQIAADSKKSTMNQTNGLKMMKTKF